MPYSSRKILTCGWLCTALLSASACSPRKLPPLTVDDLMEDRVTLDGILMKCNQNPTKSRGVLDCENARIASERLAQDIDPAIEKKHQEDFERAREQLRLAQEKVRQEQEAKTRIDPYTLPVVPVDPASAAPKAAAPPDSSPPAKGVPRRGAAPSLAGTAQP